MKGIKNIGSILVVIASILGIIFAATLMSYSVAVGVWGIILSAVSLLLGFLTFANTKSTVSTIFVITFILAIITASFSVSGLEKKHDLTTYCEHHWLYWNDCITKIIICACYLRLTIPPNSLGVFI